MSQNSLNALMALEEAPLFLTLGRLAHALIQEVYPNLNGPGKRPLIQAEEYVRSSLLAVGGILSLCEQIDLAAQSLSGFRQPRTPEIAKITRLDYIQYSLENHLLRAVMLPERALQLINVIYCLGIPESECRVATVVNNTHVKSNPIASVFHQLNEYIKPLRRTRNILVHRRRVRDPAFESVESFFALERVKAPDADRFAIVAKRMTDRILRERKEELDQFNEQAFTLVRSLFDAGEPVFESHHASLEKGSGSGSGLTRVSGRERK